MPVVFQFEGWIMVVASFALAGVKIFAFVTSLMFSADHYRAADKLSKPAWAAILGIGAAAQILIFQPMDLINLAFTIAAFVYLADVRPALSSLHQR